MSEEPDLSQNLDKATTKSNNLLKSFKEIEGVLKRINKTSQGLSSGSGNTGTTGGFSLGTEDANFYQALDQIRGGVGKIPMVGGILGAGMKLQRGQMMSMPDVNATMTRMSMGYNATVMNGFSGSNNSMRASLQRGTMAMMGTGMTSPGSDMQFANIMASSGISYSSDPNSTYMQNARQVSGLAKYLNIDNGTAAQSMANLTSGASSASLMRNLGIMTSDPMSGKMYDFKQIANQFEQRVSKGGKITAEGIMDSYHRGNLGVSLQSSGLDDTQQQMILQDLLSKAKTGKGIDYGNTAQMDKLSKDNPMLSQYKLASSDTKQMQKAEGAYKGGVDTAVNGLLRLNDAAGDLAATMGGLKASMSTFLGHRAGAGALQQVTDLASIPKDIINSIPIIGPLIAGLIPGGSANTISMSSSGAMASISGVGGNYSGGGGGGVKNSVNADSPGSPSAPGIGSSPTAGIASNTKSTGAGKSFKVMKPVNGGKIIADWNDKGDRWDGGYHKAVDWDVNEGTLVVAAHDGHLKRYDQSSSSQLGNHVKIWWGEDPKYATQYGHLKSIGVADGAWVKKGDPIGQSGRTGTNCDGPHLHFEVWHNNTRVNPHDYLDGSSASTSAAGSSKTKSSSARSSSNSSNDQSKKIPLPVSSGGAQQISSNRGKVSGSGSVDYYGGGGGSSSTIAVDPVSGGAYSSSKSSKNYLSVSDMSGGQTHPLVGGSSGGSSNSNVVINLTIGKATDNEAKKFAEKVKDYLQEDRLISNMSRS